MAPFGYTVQAFFRRFKKTELPKKLSVKKSGIFAEKTAGSGGILENQGEITQFSGFQKGEKVENFQFFMKIDNSSQSLLKFLLKMEETGRNCHKN